MSGSSAVYELFEDGSRASFGGDEFVFVEVGEAMSLPEALRIQALTRAFEQDGHPGVIDVCPANASYLVRYDPDQQDPRELIESLREVHVRFPAGERVRLATEIIEIPVFYNDPWTREVLMRFRSNHQSPSETDLEFSARVNGFDSIAELIRAHSAKPFIVTFPCFVPGNAECMQLVPQSRQLEMPKYLIPRTQTPARALGHGGAFSTIYPAAGAGGYQLLGRSAVPVVDMDQELPDFAESIVLASPSTIFKFRPIDEQEYFDIRAAVESGRYRYNRAPVDFDLDSYLGDPDGYPDELEAVLA